MKKHVWMSLVSLTAAVFFTFGGTNLVHASPSYDQEISETAKYYVGSPYHYGGTSPNGFDASGFTQYIYQTTVVHQKIDRTVSGQFRNGKPVKAGQLQLGDLVFFDTKGRGVTFVGIYIGNNQFVAGTIKGVKTLSLQSSYWKKYFIGAKRYLNNG